MVLIAITASLWGQSGSGLRHAGKGEPVYRKLLLLLVMVAAFWSTPVSAHDLGDGAHITTLVETADDGTLEFRWNLEITLQELVARFPDYDIDENGKLTSMEYGAINAREVAEYVQQNLMVKGDGKPCPVAIDAYNIMTHKRADFIQFPLQVACDSTAYTLEIHYELFFAVNPYHQGTWTVIYQQQPWMQYFWEDERHRQYQLKTRSGVQVFGEFVGKGIHHIAIGFDHILFLVSLLLPAVLVRRGGQWVPAESSRTALIRVASIVTVFTVAHSVTLSLAVLHLVPVPPATFVEAVIALSIIVMALHNIFPLFRFDVLLVTFAFGLIHGFGFAGVLLEYPLSDNALVISLVAFNVGVEAGQLVIAAVLTPLLFYFRQQPWYGKRFLPLGSGVIAALGAFWLVERLAG